MKKQKSESLAFGTFEGRHSTDLAILTFGIGTALFILFQIQNQDFMILLLGISFVFFACIINAMMLINLLYHFIILPFQREYIAVKILILLSNIPIAFIYYRFILSSIHS